MEHNLHTVSTALTISYAELETYINEGIAEPDKFLIDTFQKSNGLTRKTIWSSEMFEANACEDGRKFKFQKVVVVGQKGEQDGNFDEPVGVCSNKQGIIAVADYNNDRVQMFSSSGSFLRSHNFYTRASGKRIPFFSPAGLAFDAYGNIVVVEKGRNRVSVLSPVGSVLCSFGRHGKGEGQFRGPHGVFIDELNRIVVADTINCRVQVFDDQGGFLFMFGNNGKSKLNYPCYAIFHRDRFFVSDTDNDCVKVFDYQGSFLHKFCDSPAALKAPSGIAIYKNKYFIVCDYCNNCVKVFSLEGQFLSKFGTTGMEYGQFSGPEAIAVTQDGAIAISDKLNCRLQIFRCDVST